MTRTVVFLLALWGLAIAPTTARAIGEPASFGKCASGGSPWVADYDYSNPMSLLYQGTVGWQSYDEECIVNGTTAYIAVHVDWGSATTNPAEGSPNTITASPESMVGPGLQYCPPRFGKNIFVRTLTGATLASGCVYGTRR